MKKILILGSSGFIGKNLFIHFSKKKNFKCYGTFFTNKPKNLKSKNLFKVDLTNKKKLNNLLEFIKPDILIQAAATTSGAKDIISKPFIHVNNNAIINSVITEASFNINLKHFIFFSCTVMYKAKKKSLKETYFDGNEEMYPSYFGAGWMKIFVEKMCEFYSRISTTKFSIIRHSNIYGPYDKFDLERSHVFGASITKVMNSKKFVNIWGDGNESRDFLYINDLISFVDLAIKKQRKNFEIFNVGSSKNLSIKNLVKKIIRHSGRDLKINYDLTKKSLKNSVKLNTSKSKRILGWYPKINIDSGIKKTLEWYKKNYK